jgi:hypothetical protein
MKVRRATQMRRTSFLPSTAKRGKGARAKRARVGSPSPAAAAEGVGFRPRALACLYPTYRLRHALHLVLSGVGEFVGVQRKRPVEFQKPDGSSTWRLRVKWIAYSAASRSRSKSP